MRNNLSRAWHACHLTVGRARHRGRRLHRGWLWCLLMTWLAIAGSVTASEKNVNTRSFWSALNKSGTFVLMRHAVAPGTGDPDIFSRHDCSTQRNLSQQGREQAARIGAALRQHVKRPMVVFSSAWCRCVDTAQLLDVGRVDMLSPLNSFFRQFEREAQQTRELTQWLQRRNDTGLTVLVTHQVNITALTGVYPASGEMVAVRLSDEGGVQVLGTLAID